MNDVRSVEIPAGEVSLAAEMVVPDPVRAVVVFAHGSGSSRHSPRNRYVAGVRVAGLGGSHRDDRGPDEYTERQQARRVRRLIARARRQRPARPVGIVIAHAPIAGIGDAGHDDPVHRRFQAFHRLVGALEPLFFLHGHVDWAAGRTEHRIGATRVVNVFDHPLLELDRGAVPAGGGD